MAQKLMQTSRSIFFFGSPWPVIYCLFWVDDEILRFILWPICWIDLDDFVLLWYLRFIELLEASFLTLWWHIWRFRNNYIFCREIPKKSLLVDLYLFFRLTIDVVVWTWIGLCSYKIQLSLSLACNFYWFCLASC